MKKQLKNSKALHPVSQRDFERTAFKVSIVSILGNTALTLFKLIAGILAASGAMISDAVHSASDIFSTVIVIIGIKFSARKSDKAHPYGHERFECVAAIVLSIILLICGLFIGHTAVEKLSESKTQEVVVPGVLALVAALISIVSKEAMYWYTRHYAMQIDSGALMADAWHHRSDALSSIGALIGIAGARMGYPIMDTIASLVICLFIVKAAYDIFIDAIKKMVDHSCDEEMEIEISQCACEQDGVLGIDSIRTRVFGNKIYVDIKIFADGSIPLTESHKLAKNVHNAIEEKFDKVKHITVYVKPIKKDNDI